MGRTQTSLLMLGLFAAQLAHTQTSAPEAGTATYLLRLERTSYLRSVCVLLTANGEYHLESKTTQMHVKRGASQRVHVFEGQLSTGELREIERIVSADALIKFDQKKIPDLMMKSADERLLLDISRAGSWQQLVFPDSASRGPLRDLLERLLTRLDALNKRKARELSEDAGRNNCLPPSKIEFSQRKPIRPEEPHPRPSISVPTTPSTIPTVTPENSALLMYNNRFEGDRTEVTCLLVSPSGGYHLVQQSKDLSNGTSTAVLDGSLTPTQLGALREILDDPALVNLPEEEVNGELVPTDGGFFIKLVIPRREKTQNIQAWKSYRITNQIISRSMEDHGSKALAPLRQWLKANINGKNGVLTPNPPNPRCLPGGQPL
jgi:hypothetical protein